VTPEISPELCANLMKACADFAGELAKALSPDASRHVLQVVAAGGKVGPDNLVDAKGIAWQALVLLHADGQREVLAMPRPPEGAGESWTRTLQ
jgi:hypothetical protein